ncbi:uncharacterized protein LOC125194676 [Salvia hispanica]|uniref:uncharacterized protein LOC125194676 n=1 Tax=Salvia hispanica TaxID=49212 RepID=UPI002009086D|nr:uncharacterized protein LOC125194676 [Salvia hispanica]
MKGAARPVAVQVGDQRNKGASWATSSSSIHPVWLLGFRNVAFCTLLGLILADTILHGVGIFYYYTQWTFTLLTIYFGMASSLSILGCRIKRETKADHSIVADTEHGLFICAGAVMLTDSVYWLVLYSKEDNISFLVVCMHSVNAAGILGKPFSLSLLGREPANHTELVVNLSLLRRFID